MTDKNTKLSNKRKNSFFEKIRHFLFGDDVFISYSRRDSDYSLALANDLTKRKLSCFLDQWGTPPGKELPQELKDRVRGCSMLVLVGTKHAASSKNVGLEVEEFIKTRRPIIPITFIDESLMLETQNDSESEMLSGTLEKAEWFPLIEGVAKTIESTDALKAEKPSEKVVSRIVNAESFKSRNKRLRRSFFTLLGAITILVGLGIGVVLTLQAQAKKANDDKIEAEKNATTANQETVNARNELSNTQNSLKETSNQLVNANADLKTAENKVENANIQLTQTKKDLTKAQTQTAEAEEQTELAEANTKTAEEQTELAEANTKTAEKATEKAKGEQAEAEQLADEQKTYLARNYYERAKFQKDTNPSEALVWAQNSVKTVLDNDANLHSYKFQTLNLIQDIPKLIINSEGVVGEFSPTEDKVITIANSKQINVWNLETGRKLVELLTECNCNIPDIWKVKNPIFSPDGKLISAITQESGFLRLHVWEANAEGRETVSFDITNTITDREISFFSFAPDSRAILIGLQDDNRSNRLLILNASNGNPIQGIPIEGLEPRYFTRENSSPIPDTFLISKNPKHNWIIAFDESEEGMLADVIDIYSGKTVFSIPTLNSPEYLGFTGASGRVVAVSYVEKNYQSKIENGERVKPCKFNNDNDRSSNSKIDENCERVLSAWDIESKKATVPTKFTTGINQKYEIVGVTNDDKRLIVHAGNISIDVWNIALGKAVDFYSFWGSISSKNLKASFSNDKYEKYLIAETDSLTSSQIREINIYDTKPQLPTEYSLTKFYIESKYNLERFVSQSLDKYYQTSSDGIISIYNLKRNEEKFAPPGNDVIPEGDNCLLRGYQTPAQSKILTIYNNPCSIYSENPTTLKMQLWNTLTGQKMWSSPEGVLLKTLTDRQRLNDEFTFELVFDQLRGRFITMVQKSKDSLNSDDPNRENTIQSWETETGKPTENFKPISGKIRNISFNEDYSKLITVEVVNEFNWEINQRDASTGEIISGVNPNKINVLQEGEVAALAGQGKYLILLPYGTSEGFSKNKEISIKSLDPNQNLFNRYNLYDHESAMVAVKLLSRANIIYMTEDDSLIAEFDSGFSISINTFGEIFLISKDGLKTQFVAKKDYLRSSVSSDGRLLLYTDKNLGDISVLDTATGTLLLKNVKSLSFSSGFFELSASGDSVMTIGADKKIHYWNIPSVKNGKGFWLEGMSEALTGMKVIDATNIQRISQSSYLQMRQDYMEKLINSLTIDSEARFILERWNP